MAAPARLDGSAGNDRAGHDGRAPAGSCPDGGDTAALLHEICHLRRAVVSRAQVGIACGLVASRYGCTTDQALALLLRISQTSNIKLRQIARVMQQSFDGAALSDDQARVLAAIVVMLPGGWPPQSTDPA